MEQTPDDLMPRLRQLEALAHAHQAILAVLMSAVPSAKDIAGSMLPGIEQHLMHQTHLTDQQIETAMLEVRGLLTRER